MRTVQSLCVSRLQDIFFLRVEGEAKKPGGLSATNNQPYQPCLAPGMLRVMDNYEAMPFENAAIAKNIIPG